MVRDPSQSASEQLLCERSRPPSAQSKPTVSLTDRLLLLHRVSSSDRSCRSGHVVSRSERTRGLA
eukprot:8802029-Pyramimonas_sp.AAC.1